jgi:hypothetical protein
MNHLRSFVPWMGSSLVAALFLSLSGCSGDEGQPARGSISAPRKGGAMEGAGAPDKGQPAGGKLGGKGGGL